MTKKERIDGETPTKSELSPTEQLKKDINKKYDSNVMINAQEIVEKERKVVSISPTLDIVTQGGVVEGSWCLLSGPAKCGKTITALQICANAQSQYNKPIFFGNVEHRANCKEFIGIHGLNIVNIEVIQSQQNKILTAQDFLQEFTTILKTVPECVLVIDSTSSLCSETEYASDITAQFRNEGPKLLATFCRRMASVVPVQRSIIIIIQHLIANTGNSYGNPVMEDGGYKIQYQADLKLRCTSFQKWNLVQNDDNTQIGQIVNWRVMTSSLGKPGGRTQSHIRYGYGIDYEKELIGLGCDLGIITKGGAWYTFNDIKCQGEEKLRDELIANPKQLEKLKQLIKTNMI